MANSYSKVGFAKVLQHLQPLITHVRRMIQKPISYSLPSFHSSTADVMLLMIGSCLIVIGLIFNEWALPLIFSGQHLFVEPTRLIAVRVIFGLCVIGGSFLIFFRYWILRHRADLLLFATTVFFLAGTSIVLDGYLGYRVSKYGRSDSQIHNVHIPHKKLGWISKPGALGYHFLKNNFDVEYRMDEEGFKQTPHRAMSQITVYFFGDSYTFGHGVRNEDTFANIIANDYVNSHVQIVNAGVKGYGIVQMYGRFLELARVLKKDDLVVFTPTSQDVQRNWEDFRSPAQFMFNGEDPRVEYYPYFRNGQLEVGRIHTVRNQIKAFFLLAPFTGNLFASVDRAIMNIQDKEQAHEIFEIVQSSCEVHGAKFVLFFLPTVKELRRKQYEVDISSFRYHDIREFFPQEVKALRSMRFPDNSHWNRSGHEIAAQAIMETLVREKLIKEKYVQPRPL